MTKTQQTRIERRGDLEYVIDVEAERRNAALWAAHPGEYRTGEATVIAVRRADAPR